MSIMQEYEQIRKEIGYKKYDAIDTYLNEKCPKENYDKYQKELISITTIPGISEQEWLKKKENLEAKYGIILLSDVLYKSEEWDKFEKWYQDKQKENTQENKKKSKDKEAR